MDSLSIGLTYDSVSLGTGTHTVRGVVAATGLPSGVTLVEQDVEVLIEITGSEDTPSEEEPPAEEPPADDGTQTEETQPEEGGAET